MKTSLLAVFALSSVCLADQNHIAIRITDAKGLPIQGAQAVAILKSGAYQNTKLDPSDGQYKCDPAEECVKIYAAAPGFEGLVKKTSGGAGVIDAPLRASATKSSVVIRRSGSLPGIDGNVNPYVDSIKRTGIFGTRIGFEEHGHPAQQPVYFVVNRPIEAKTSTGQKFKICVIDITQECSLLEFTIPK